MAVACKRLFGPHQGLGPWETDPDPWACLAYASLLDHFVRLEQDDRGNGEAEGLGGLQVDDQLKLHGLLDRQGTRLQREPGPAVSNRAG